MLAKLELYEFLVNILNIEEEVSLDFIKAELVKISYLCRRTFTCEHILLRAIEELPHIFCVSKASSNSTEKCVVHANGQIQELWDAFGTDSLLKMLLETYLQLSAEIQLYIYLLNSQHVYKNLIELHKIVQNISESCARYFFKVDCLETFLSFYFNFNLFDEKEDLLEKIKDHLKLFASYEPLILYLNEYFQEQYEIYQVVVHVKNHLKIQHQISLKSNYYKHSTFFVKKSLSLFYGIFLIQEENITLLGNEWEDKHLCKFKNVQSENIVTHCKSYTEISMEINIYCYLIFHATNGIKIDMIKPELQRKGFLSYLKTKTIIGIIKKFYKVFQIKDNSVVLVKTEFINLSRKYSTNVTEIETSSECLEEKRNTKENEKEYQNDGEDLETLGKLNCNSDFKRCQNHRLATVFINSGRMCAVTETVGYVQVDDDIMQIIVDVVYMNQKQVKNLHAVHTKNINFIAIKSEEELIDYWKISLAWIGIKPENIPCAITFDSVWETVKLLYEKRWNEFRCLVLPNSKNFLRNE
ncbi:uncharacterized protein LOC111623656 isoform X1 [Centruroides sculpturatus]|uniref:uncharacterized protein LOC111623656 isoform X1 n=1 Tax=Centruroides sculpturatus TaxID=218467 RepID=UPI000C6C8BCF|nr:uncharacterized protein LOC111623656 isoform X1 [Centruroides sculpturatus]